MQVVLKENILGVSFEVVATLENGLMLIDNIHINDSFKIRNNKEKENIIMAILNIDETYICQRPLEELITEWSAHNVLYRLGIARSRTKDVDLDANESKFRKFIYKILAIFE